MNNDREEYTIPEYLRNPASVAFEKWVEVYALNQEPLPTNLEDRNLDCKFAFEAGYAAALATSHNREASGHVYHEQEPERNMWEIASDEISSDHTTPQPNKEVAELVEALDTAIKRLNDMLIGDDGQAWKEARKTLPLLEQTLAKHKRSE